MSRRSDDAIRGRDSPAPSANHPAVIRFAQRFIHTGRAPLIRPSRGGFLISREGKKRGEADGSDNGRFFFFFFFSFPHLSFFLSSFLPPRRRTRGDIFMDSAIRVRSAGEEPPSLLPLLVLSRLKGQFLRFHLSLGTEAAYRRETEKESVRREEENVSLKRECRAVPFVATTNIGQFN